MATTTTTQNGTTTTVVKQTTNLLQVGERDLGGDCLRINRNFDLISSLLDGLTQKQKEITNTVAQISGGGGGGGTSSNDFINDILLSGPTTITSPQAPTNGQLLTLILRQDSTGGRTISFGSGFASTVVDIDTTANTISTMQFVGTGGIWTLCATTLTGVIPANNVPSGSSHNAAASILLDMGISGGSQNVPALGTAMNGQHGAVFLTETTGGTAITWDASYSAQPSDIDTSFGTVSSFEFIGANNFFVMVGLAATGVPRSSIAGGGSPITGTAPNLLLDQSLTSGSTMIVSPSTPSNAQRLTVLLRQDATGGRTISWDSNFDGVVTDIDGTPNTLSAFRFYGSGGKWIMCGIPLSGV